MINVTTAVLTLALLLGLSPVAVRGQDVTPPAPTTAEALLTVMLDRDQLPGEDGFIVLGRKTFQPGSRRTYDSTGAVGSEAVVVTSGELTYEIPGSGGRILRGTGTASSREEAAPAGSPFTLAAGDALVYPIQTHIESNDGDEPVDYYFVAILEPVAPPEPDPSDIGEATEEILALSQSMWPDLPSGPAELTLRPATLPAGDMLPAPAGGIQAIAQTSLDPGALILADNGALNLGEQPADLLVAALAPVGSAPATPPDVRTGTPSSAPASSEVLLETTLPASALPAGPAAVELWRSTWAPGDQAEFPAYHPTVSVGGDVVLSGEYAARSDGDIVAWHDGQFEEVQPGEEVTLSTRDAVIYLDNAADQTVRNAGSSTTEIASFAITLGEDYVGPNLGVDWEQAGLSGNDVTLTIERQTLAPGASLPALTPNPAEPALRIVEEGELAWRLIHSDARDTAPALRFGPGSLVPFAVLPAGGQIELRNAGADPLVLLTMTLSRANDSAGTSAGG